MCFSQLYCYKAPEPGKPENSRGDGECCLWPDCGIPADRWLLVVWLCLCSDAERKKGCSEGRTGKTEQGETRLRVSATCPGAGPGEIPCRYWMLELEAQFPWLLQRQGRNGLTSSQWWQGDVEWQLGCAQASGKFSLEFGFSFSILPTHLHVPRYYKTLKVLLVGNIHFVWKVGLALGWLPAWKCLSAIAFPWSHYALASGFTKSWVVVCSYLKPLCVFCNETGLLIWKKLHLEQLLSGKRILGRNHDQLCPWCQCNTCLTGFLLENPYIDPVLKFFFSLNTTQFTAEHQSPPHPVLKGLMVIFPTISNNSLP